MSAIHRIDDIMQMTAATFFSRALRLFAYPGMIALRVTAEREAGAPTALPTGEAVTPAPSEADALAGLGDLMPERVTEGGA